MTNISSKELRDEIANSITHGLGLVLCVLGIPILLAYAVNTDVPFAVLGATVFGFCLIMVYLSSTLYHSFQNPTIKKVMRILDHISIFLLIGGSYTPFLLFYFTDSFAWLFLSIIWSIVLVGSILKIFFVNKFRVLSAILYLIVGWLAIFIIKPMIVTMPTEVLLLIVSGGISYSVGVIFYIKKSIPYNHAIWHLFVMAGSILHYIAVARCLV